MLSNLGDRTVIGCKRPFGVCVYEKVDAPLEVRQIKLLDDIYHIEIHGVKMKIGLQRPPS